MKTEQARVEKLIKIFEEKTYNKKLSFDSTIQETAIDSLKFIQVIVEIEKAFKIKFNDNDLDLHEYKTISDFYNYIQSKT